MAVVKGELKLGTSNQITGRIVWESVSNGIDANTSTVKATIQVMRTNAYTTYGTWTGTLQVYNTSKTFSTYASVSNSWVNLCTIENVTVPHSDDGTGGCYLYGQIKGPSETSQANSVVKNSGTATFETIPRYASITSAPNFNDEENPTIQYSNPAGSSVTKLEACISLDGPNDDIRYQDHELDPTATSYTFVLTEDERDILRRNTQNGSTTRTVKFCVRTILNGKVETSSVVRNFEVVKCIPQLQATIIETDDTINAVTGRTDVLIRNQGAARCEVFASGMKGAYIESCTVTCGNVVKSMTDIGQDTFDATIENPSDARFVFRVVDSRGQSASLTVDNEQENSWVQYIKPTCVLGNDQPNADGVLTLGVSGQYYDGYFDVYRDIPQEENTILLYYRYAVVGEEMPSEWTMSEGENAEWSANKYRKQLSIQLPDYNKAYLVEVYAADKLRNTDVVSKMVKASPIFDWSDEDFNLNVKMNMGGHTVLRRNNSETDIGYGNLVISSPEAQNGVYIRPNGTDDENGQTVFWNTGDISVSGSVGVTNTLVAAGGIEVGEKLRVYGQTVLDDDLYILHAMLPVGVQSVLWGNATQTGWYMRSDQTATLSSPISHTVNGIVLIFAPYSASTATALKSNYNSFFIPKYAVNLLGTVTHHFNMGIKNFDVACMKVLKISDTSIQGVDENVASGTGASGITYDNAKYVLRYVIAV